MNPMEQMILDSFQSKVYIESTMDVQNTPIYDTVVNAAGTSMTPTNTAFFTNVGPASGKTLAQTNMQRGNTLIAPEAFSVFGFRYKWKENVLPADLYSILDNFCLEFYLGNKYYQRAPLWYYQPGAGIFANTTATNTTYLANGVPTRESMHKLAINVVIENQMNFNAQLQGNSLALSGSGTGYTHVLLLDGLYARGVQ
jgi:hypothetical protein